MQIRETRIEMRGLMTLTDHSTHPAGVGAIHELPYRRPGPNCGVDSPQSTLSVVSRGKKSPDNAIVGQVLNLTTCVAQNSYTLRIHSHSCASGNPETLPFDQVIRRAVMRPRLTV